MKVIFFVILRILFDKKMISGKGIGLKEIDSIAQNLVELYKILKNGRIK